MGENTVHTKSRRRHSAPCLPSSGREAFTRIVYYGNKKCKKSRFVLKKCEIAEKPPLNWGIGNVRRAECRSPLHNIGRNSVVEYRKVCARYFLGPAAWGRADISPREEYTYASPRVSIVKF
ncbi:hypothetical protein EVAR_25368_1 [Eumeta japonica]|uniref:Uncharacterized protein n=1 Tax=Eumeta variegata TaxID=151549 RepID=A0A4C1XVL8_EUMVA|nr:hypothetical protein EVAR_25368_1 [Eumeta japonica]